MIASVRLVLIRDVSWEIGGSGCMVKEEEITERHNIDCCLC